MVRKSKHIVAQFSTSDFEAQVGREMTTAPLPGRPVRGSRTGQPIMAALDLLGRRWALRVLWELRDEPLGFRALQQRCDGMSSSVLRDRLAELTAAGLVATVDDGRYALTGTGRSLGQALGPLHEWAKAWARQAAGPGATPRHRATDGRA
jgi:DNA-binding HxlR family transcriptional regulator